MAIIHTDNYKNVKYRSFPREKSRGKDYEWYLAYMSSLFHRYKTGYGVEHVYNSTYLKNLEKYALGTQGASKVKEKLLRQQKDGTFKGRMKDVFQTFDILPEFIDIMLSTNMRADYKPTAMAIDKVSLLDKDLEMGIAKHLVQEETKEFLKYMSVKVDSVLTDEEIATFSDSDIDVLFKTGGLQLQREIEAVACCNDSMVSSKHKDIENKNTFDLIAYGIAAVKTYIDHSDDNVKYSYVDPKNLLIPKSKYNDFRDISYAAEFRMMRIHEVISKCPSIRRDQIEELIEGCFGYNKDFSGIGMDEFDGYMSGQNSVYDEFLVPVLDAQWLSNDVEVYLQFPTSNGGFDYKRVKNDYELDKKQKKTLGTRLDRKKFVKRYEALWVVGTEILLSYGEAKDNVYYGPKGKRIPKLDFSIVKTGKKSLVDRARTTVDDINLYVAKHRSAIATLPPGPGLIIYEHALQNIKFGGKLQTAKDLIDGLIEGGVLVVNGRDSKGGYIASNGGKAVDQIPATAVQQIAVFGNEILNKVNQLRQLLGIPEGLDGTSGNPYTGVGQVKLAASASSNALFPTLSMIGPLYEDVFDKAVPKWQILSKKGPIELGNIKTSSQFKVLSLSENFSNYDFKVKIVFSPTEEEKSFLIQQVNDMAIAYVQSGGSIGCSKAEFFMLYRLIKAGLLEECMYQVARIEKMREANNIRVNKMNMEENGKQNNESIELNKQARLEQIKEESRQERLNEAARIKEETKRDLTKVFLESYDKESGSIPEAIYSQLTSNADEELSIIESESAADGVAEPPTV